MSRAQGRHQSTRRNGEDAGQHNGIRSDLVYEDVRRRILSGELQSGSAVRLDEVAHRVGVSQTPAREALARLQATGLITYEPRRGFRVAQPLSAAELDDLMDARELLQHGAARLAAERGCESLADALETVVERHERAIATVREQAGARVSREERQSAAWEVVQAEMAFHQTVIDHAQNTFVSLMASTLAGHSHRSGHSVVRPIESLEQSVREHRAIVRAARYGDPETVAAAMLVHLRLMRRRAREDAAAPAVEEAS